MANSAFPRDPSQKSLRTRRVLRELADYVQAAYFLGGPVSGNPAAASYRALANTDIPFFNSNQQPNYGLMGPTTGPAAPATMRAFVPADIPLQNTAVGPALAFMGPVSGANALPGFRTIAATDLPAAFVATDFSRANYGTGDGNTVANTTSTTVFSSQYVIPANTLAVGAMVRVKAKGTYITALTPTLILQINCGNGQASTGTLTLGTTGPFGWEAEATFLVKISGASGYVQTCGKAQFQTAAGTTLDAWMTPNPTAQNFDTTVAETVSASVAFGTASASDAITLTQMTVEVLTPPSVLTIFDSFTDTNGTALASHTPDLDTPGSAWKDQSSAGLSAVINNPGNSVEFNYGGNPGGFLVEIDSGAKDATVQLTMYFPSASGNTTSDMDVVFRYQDSGNYIIVVLGPGAGGLKIYQQVSGSFTQLAATAFTVTLDVNWTLVATIIGNKVTGTVLQNGKTVSYTGVTVNPTGTKHGIRYASTSTADIGYAISPFLITVP